MNIVYVSGFGRSGSSIFDLMLSRALGAVSTGELCNLFAWAAAGRDCSCGQPVVACPLWGPVLEAVLGKTRLSADQLAAASDAAELGRRDAALWRDIWEAVFAAMPWTDAGDLIVDSSKTAGNRRRLELLRSLSTTEGLHSVHLIRSLAGSVASLRKGGNKAMEAGSSEQIRWPTLKACAGWSWANWSARDQARFTQSTLVLRYEDLVRHPDVVLDNLRRQLPTTSAQGHTIHQIAGNRVLRNPSRDRLALDVSWRSLPAGAKILALGVERTATLSRIAPRSDASLTPGG